MELDVLAQLNSLKGEFAFVATYEFDPVFFDRRILATRAFESAKRIVIFMDASRYGELLRTGLASGQFDRRYFVVPVRRKSGVFHPKVIVSIAEAGALAIVGSNNCTAAGTGHNLELVSAFSWNAEELNTQLQRNVIASAFQLLRHYASGTGPISNVLEGDCFLPASDLHPWIGDQRTIEAAPPVELLSSHDGPLLPQVLDRLRGQSVRDITVLAPFFDDQAALISRFHAVWPSASIRIFAQPAYSNLPAGLIGEMQDAGAAIALIAAEPPLGRRLHAKAFAFETAEKTFWLVGSANASDAALVGGNSEACLWFSAAQNGTSALQQEELHLTPISPLDFVSAPTSEPAQPSTEENYISLRSLVLMKKNELRGSWVAAREVSEVTLELYRLSEALPAMSLRVPASKCEFILELGDGQSALFDRPIFGRLKATCADQKILSAPASVMQLPSLLRERDSIGRAGNQLRRIADSGDGLIEHMDTLGSIQESIQFLNNVNIRFDDGTASGGGGTGSWKARDPFSGDFPDHWDLAGLDGTRDELRDAIWEFVQRHVRDKLMRHVQRGNLNGLVNFLDISRTLNALLLAYHHRRIDGEPIIPHPYVTQGMQEVLSSLIGPAVPKSDISDGYVAAVRKNLRGDENILQEHLHRHEVAATVLATIEALIEVRASALQCSRDDSWSTKRRQWVENWLEQNGLATPHEAVLGAARSEYQVAA